MKTIRNILLIGLTIMFVLTSCTMEKRVYRSGYHTEWLTAKLKGHSGNYKNCSVCTPSQKESSVQLDQTTIAKDPDLIDDNTTSTDDGIVASVDNKQIILTKKKKNDWLTKSKIINQENQRTIEQDQECDIIILKNGQEIKAKVLEVGTTEIKYKMCDNLNGPTFSKSKSDIFMIKYPNGTKTVISEIDNKSASNQTTISGDKKTEPLSLISFISSLVGLLVFGILFGTASVIMSAIGLGKINKNPEKWKGKGFAIAGIIIGLIDILAFFIILALLL